MQALLDTQYTGPEWEKLTGITVNVVQLPFEEICTKTNLEHQAGTEDYYIAKYGVQSEFDGPGVSTRCSRARPLVSKSMIASWFI